MKARLVLNEIKQSVEGSGLGALGVGKSGIINKITAQIKEVLDKWNESYEIGAKGFPAKKITVMLKYNITIHYSYENYILILISYDKKI